MGAYGKLALASGSRAMASRLANEAVNYVVRKRSGNRSSSSRIQRPFARNAGVGYARSRPKRFYVEYQSSAKAKDTLQIGSFLAIPQGTDVSDRSGSRIFVQGVWIENFLKNNISTDITYYRSCVVSYADYEVSSGTNLFKDVAGTSSAVDFTNITGFNKITNPYHRSSVGIVQESLHPLAKNSTGNNAFYKHTRVWVPINKFIEFEGSNPIPSLRHLSWHSPQNPAATPTLAFNTTFTVVFRDVF